jgi:hypothetical protein
VNPARIEAVANCRGIVEVQPAFHQTGIEHLGADRRQHGPVFGAVGSLHRRDCAAAGVEAFDLGLPRVLGAQSHAEHIETHFARGCFPDEVRGLAAAQPARVERG